MTSTFIIMIIFIVATSSITTITSTSITTSSTGTIITITIITGGSAESDTSTRAALGPQTRSSSSCRRSSNEGAVLLIILALWLCLRLLVLSLVLPRLRLGDLCIDIHGFKTLALRLQGDILACAQVRIAMPQNVHRTFYANGLAERHLRKLRPISRLMHWSG